MNKELREIMEETEKKLKEHYKEDPTHEYDNIYACTFDE